MWDDVPSECSSGSDDPVHRIFMIKEDDAMEEGEEQEAVPVVAAVENPVEEVKADEPVPPVPNNKQAEKAAARFADHRMKMVAIRNKKENSLPLTDSELAIQTAYFQYIREHPEKFQSNKPISRLVCSGSSGSTVKKNLELQLEPQSSAWNEDEVQFDAFPEPKLNSTNMERVGEILSIWGGSMSFLLG